MRLFRREKNTRKKDISEDSEVAFLPKRPIDIDTCFERMAENAENLLGAFFPAANFLVRLQIVSLR